MILLFHILKHYFYFICFMYFSFLLNIIVTQLMFVLIGFIDTGRTPYISANAAASVRGDGEKATKQCDRAYHGKPVRIWS